MIFFIADLHFGHKNCIRYDNRPFNTIEEHDETLIANWNNRVSGDDTVYILGDFSWYDAQKTIEIFNRLNGHKILIEGNHDKKLLKQKKVRELFDEIVSYKEIQITIKHLLVLCHYPIPCFNRHYYGDYHFYGHVHTSFEHNMMKSIRGEMEELYDKPCKMYNVGAMCPEIDYTPRTFEEIIERNGDIVE